MDWKTIAVNLFLSAIIAILLIIANWAVNIWDQRSSWGRWKQVFLGYHSISSAYYKVQDKKTQILERFTIFNGTLFFVSVVLVLFEMLFVSIFASWLNVDPSKIYSLLFGIFFVLELPLLSSILTKVFLRGNTSETCTGLRYSTHAVYLSAIGMILAAFNLKPSGVSALFGLLATQALVVGVVAVASKYLELLLFSALWQEMITNNDSIVFPYVTLALKSGHLISGQLIDFMNKATLVIKHGGEYLHVPWNEIEFIKVLKQP